MLTEVCVGRIAIMQHFKSDNCKKHYIQNNLEMTITGH